jgi:hypothetical protein
LREERNCVAERGRRGTEGREGDGRMAIKVTVKWEFYFYSSSRSNE